MHINMLFTLLLSKIFRFFFPIVWFCFCQFIFLQLSLKFSTKLGGCSEELPEMNSIHMCYEKIYAEKEKLRSVPSEYLWIPNPDKAA